MFSTFFANNYTLNNVFHIFIITYGIESPEIGYNTNEKDDFAAVENIVENRLQARKKAGFGHFFARGRHPKRKMKGEMPEYLKYCSVFRNVPI